MDKRYKLYIEWDNGWCITREARFNTLLEAIHWKNYFVEREDEDEANIGNHNLACSLDYWSNHDGWKRIKLLPEE